MIGKDTLLTVMPDGVLVCPVSGDFCIEDVVVKWVDSPDPTWRHTLDLANAILYTRIERPTLKCVMDLCAGCDLWPGSDHE